MPIGVQIYDIEANAVIFENSQFKSMVEVKGEGGKEACQLKPYVQNSESLVQEEKKT